MRKSFWEPVDGVTPSEMFRVVVKYEFTDDFAARDDELFALAGKPSSWSGAGVSGLRDHGWLLPTWEKAQILRLCLEQASFPIAVSIEEHTTYGDRP